MTRSISLSFYLAFLTGCAGTVPQFEIVPTSNGTFIIPSQGLMGASSSSTEKAKAYDAASTFCTKRGGVVETVLTSANEGDFREIAAPEIEFRCVTPAPR